MPQYSRYELANYYPKNIFINVNKTFKNFTKAAQSSYMYWVPFQDEEPLQIFPELFKKFSFGFSTLDGNPNCLILPD